MFVRPETLHGHLHAGDVEVGGWILVGDVVMKHEAAGIQKSGSKANKRSDSPP